MDDSKRDFLKKAGMSIVGFGCLGAATSAVGRAVKSQPRDGAYTAGRWGMVIDAAKCAENEGCTRCMDKCHLVHNVPNVRKQDGSVDAQHELKWLWKEEHRHVFPTDVHDRTPKSLRERQTLVLCNHCTNAPCVRVCPTQATWRRSDGLVMMDMHRCIGCRYCVVACPYGARSFNWKDPRPYIGEQNDKFPTRMKGVVEKCNFCAERLARGEMPVCVVECAEVFGKNLDKKPGYGKKEHFTRREDFGAIVFGDVSKPGPMQEVLESNNTLRRKFFLGTKPHVFYIV